MESFDDTLENADWLKQSWDLPPYKSPEFLSIFPDLDAFRRLPVYQHAVASGLIANDTWAGEKAELGKALKRALRQRKTGITLPQVSQERPAVRAARTKMTGILSAFFSKVKGGLIKQTVYAVNRRVHKLAKAEDDDFDLSMVDGVMAEIDFSVFNQLPSKVQDALEEMFSNAGSTALSHVGVAVAANKGAPELNPGAFNQVNKAAVAYAEKRSAEMVGMKYVDGKLVPNPNAKWQIADTTRDGIRSSVADVVAGRLPSTELADTLRSAYDFSHERAEMIARTEIHKANGEGALSGYRASGVVEQKVWLTSGDDDVSEECGENEDEGPIPIDEEFPSGDLAEPAHPNCRCTIAPYVEWGDGTQDGSTDDEEE
jgi:SPP1 gp7 family putative phage head morphogenesis protein